MANYNDVEKQREDIYSMMKRVEKCIDDLYSFLDSDSISSATYHRILEATSKMSLAYRIALDGLRYGYTMFFRENQ